MSFGLWEPQQCVWLRETDSDFGGKGSTWGSPPPCLCVYFRVSYKGLPIYWTPSHRCLFWNVVPSLPLLPSTIMVSFLFKRGNKFGEVTAKNLSLPGHHSKTGMFLSFPTMEDTILKNPCCGKDLCSYMKTQFPSTFVFIILVIAIGIKHLWLQQSLPPKRLIYLFGN